jgi:dynein heavy chain, axonemal
LYNILVTRISLHLFSGLCAWVINIIKFYEVFCEVEPKRIALADANAELAAAQEKLRMIKEQIEV